LIKGIKVLKCIEGQFNKAFFMTMNNGAEVLAKIPNPNAGPAFYTTASEVGTRNFVSGVLFAHGQTNVYPAAARSLKSSFCHRTLDPSSALGGERATMALDRGPCKLILLAWIAMSLISEGRSAVDYMTAMGANEM
jgi:hypothetical protein